MASVNEEQAVSAKGHACDDETERTEPELGYLRVFERLRLQNEQLKEELLDLQRRHVELQRAHIDTLEQLRAKSKRREMTEEERERIIWLAWEGHHPREIADQVNRPYGTVRALISRAQENGELS